MCPYGFVAGLGCRARLLVRSYLPKMRKAEDGNALTGTWLELPGVRSFLRKAFLLKHSSHC